MAELIGLVASVVQVAGAGLQLSKTLYEYVDGVATADRRIKDIATEIKMTSVVIEELGDVFKHKETASLVSQKAVMAANDAVKECSALFTQIDATLKKSKKNTFGRLALPFRDTKLELLRSHVDKLKSTLQLLMQVLTHAYQIASRKLDRAAEIRQREEIKKLLERKDQSTQKHEELLRKDSASGDSTLVDDNEFGRDIGQSTTSDAVMTAAAISSTITAQSLAACVDHVRRLLRDIEILQKALATTRPGDDHSRHHDTLVDSYFRARGHLDQVVLGGSKYTSSASLVNPRAGTDRTHEALSGRLETEAQMTKSIETGELLTRVSLADRANIRKGSSVNPEFSVDPRLKDTDASRCKSSNTSPGKLPDIRLTGSLGTLPTAKQDSNITPINFETEQAKSGLMTSKSSASTERSNTKSLQGLPFLPTSQDYHQVSRPSSTSGYGSVSHTVIHPKPRSFTSPTAKYSSSPAHHDGENEDAETAARLAALRLAEDQFQADELRRRRARSGVFSSNTNPPSPPLYKELNLISYASTNARPYTPQNMVSYDASSTLSGHEAGPDKVPTKSKASDVKARKRTKTGCLTCRKRHIKCGNEQPTCKNCSKSRRQCEGYKQRVVVNSPTAELLTHPNIHSPVPLPASMGPSTQQQPSRSADDTIVSWQGLMRERSPTAGLQRPYSGVGHAPVDSTIRTGGNDERDTFSAVASKAANSPPQFVIRKGTSAWLDSNTGAQPATVSLSQPKPYITREYSPSALKRNRDTEVDELLKEWTTILG